MNYPNDAYPPRPPPYEDTKHAASFEDAATAAAAAEDFVEGGSTLSGQGGILSSRNASPYSSMTDLLRRQQQQVVATSNLIYNGAGRRNNDNDENSRQQQQQGTTATTTTTARKTTTTTTTPAVVYGAPNTVPTAGNFPSIGSTLGPYFSVGRLGKGTFCSIHKCINLDYFHHRRNKNNDNNDKTKPNKTRLAAAKVEIGEFINSGILGGEASILHYLHTVLEDHTVPIYMGHYQAIADTDNSTTDNANNSAVGANATNGSNVDKRKNPTNGNNSKTITSAIVMEYLPGQDMHAIRDWATKQRQQQQQSAADTANGESVTPRQRRLSVEDAVFLTANVMLPLLQRMHSVGIVHRDVKPSNVVKRVGSSTSREFCVVDFGLSKSIVVPSDSSLADTDHVWRGKDWMKTIGMNLSVEEGADGTVTTKTTACYRKERQSADFRGTSMYASVPVHQLRDYSPRDDIWSLLYVFCDLVSGGLPWMSHAATRDRESCHKLKERIHGMTPHADGQLRRETYRLLMGDEYHVALYRKYRGGIDPPEKGGDEEETEEVVLPEPLELSKHTEKVQLLDRAFEHLKQLKFTDLPDYDLIRTCLEGFFDSGERKYTNLVDPIIPPIDWRALSLAFNSQGSGEDVIDRENSNLFHSDVPTWKFAEGEDDMDPLDEEDPDMFAEADFVLRNSPEEEQNNTVLFGEAADLARLPVEMRFRIAQMEYNVQHPTTIAPHHALYDFLQVAIPLLYGNWDSAKYEKGGHRFNNDGYRREFFLRVVEKCIDCAATFRNFRDKECFYHSKVSSGAGGERTLKRRKVNCTMHEPEDGLGSDLMAVSKVMFELRMTKKAEEVLPRAPPPRLAFGS